VLDLDYAEDSTADVDMNVAMLDNGKFVELQASSEKAPFDDKQLGTLLALAKKGITRLMTEQKKASSQQIWQDLSREDGYKSETRSPNF